MKCAKVRELLRDYLRGQTDSQTTLAVANHLGACEDCARELAFLGAYYSKIGSLEKLEAPDNFLGNIKQQLDQTGERAGVSRWSKLWVWKAPQMAGALMVALIVMLIFNPFQIGQKINQAAKTQPEMAPQTMASEDQSQEIGALGSNQSQSKSAFALEKESQVLDSKGVAPGAASMSGEGKPTTGSGGEPERRLIFTMRQPAVMGNKALADTSASAVERSGSLETVINQKPDQEKSGLKKEQSLAIFNSTGVLTVKALIKSVDGEVLQQESAENDQPPSLRIRIPVQNYAAFLEKLQEIGAVDDEGLAPPPSLSKTPGTGEPNQQQFVETRLILKGVF